MRLNLSTNDKADIFLLLQYCKPQGEQIMLVVVTT